MSKKFKLVLQTLKIESDLGKIPIYIHLNDNGNGPYITLEQYKNKIDIDLEELPLIIKAIEKLSSDLDSTEAS